MDPTIGEPFILRCKGVDDAGDIYYPALVEGVSGGKIVAARIAGLTIYRLGFGDETIRFQSRTVHGALQSLMERGPARALIFYSRESAMMALLEEMAFHTPSKKNEANA